MKKLFITAAAVLSVMALNAKVLNVGEIHRVDLGGHTIDRPVLSADGSFVVAQGHDGLQKIDLADGTAKTIVPGLNLYNIVISSDGQTVAYIRPSYTADHLRMTSLEAVSLDNGRVEVVVKPTRNLATGVAVNGGTVSAVSDGQLSVKAISANGSQQSQSPVVGISYGHLTVNGNTVDPLGKGSYLWPSLSPDGKKIVFWCVGQGCYVSNLDGSDVRKVGGLRAAVWAGNDVIVGMQDLDDGEFVVASKIVAHDLATGERQDLTSDDYVAMYPSATAGRVAFCDPMGNLYFMDIEK